MQASAVRLFGITLALTGFAGGASAQGTDSPYHLLKTAKVGGDGGWDYVATDPENRRLYIPRGTRVAVYDLDTLASVGEIANAPSVHGAVVDPASHHGFCSSQPVVMWDTRTLATIKTIPVGGGPDGIAFDAASGYVFILSHRAPNLTAIDARDGTVVGTVDIGGAPEQAASDGMGHLFVDVEDKDQVAVVDTKTLKVTAHYSLGGKGGTPAGLVLDPVTHVLFACCRSPATCVMLSAEDGRILGTLPIGAATDGAAFNPATKEVFSSQGDGTVTVIREQSATEFKVEQTVPTKVGARTCALDARTGHLFLIDADYEPAPAAPAAGGPVNRRPRRGPMVTGSFTILMVGR